MHAGSVAAFGVNFLKMMTSGDSTDLVPLIASLVAVSAASSGAVALGFGLRTLTVGSIDCVPSTSEAGEGKPTDIAIPRTAYQNGRIGALLCFVYAGIGLVAIATLFLLRQSSSGIGASIALLNLWLLASVILIAVGIFGGDFLERFLPLVGIYDDPLHLLRWFAGLTPFFSNWFLFPIWIAFSGACLALPFGLCPLLGIAAFWRIHQVGSRLARMKLGSSGAKFGSAKSSEPS